MSFRKIGVWVLLAAFLLLPLYELADYSEVWQHDEDLVLPGLLFLFSGMALLARRFVYKAVLVFVGFVRMAYRVVIAVQRFARLRTSIDPFREHLLFIFCDLRI